MSNVSMKSKEDKRWRVFFFFSLRQLEAIDGLESWGHNSAVCWWAVKGGKEVENSGGGLVKKLSNHCWKLSAAGPLPGSLLELHNQNNYPLQYLTQNITDT